MAILGDILLIAACIYAVIICTQELLKYVRIKRAGRLVEGEIIGYEKKIDDGITYPAIVTYTTFEGQKITATSGTSSSIKPSIGKRVWIVYDSSDPTTFYFQKSSVPYISVVFIISFGGAGIFVIVELLKVL